MLALAVTPIATSIGLRDVGHVHFPHRCAAINMSQEKAIRHIAQHIKAHYPHTMVEVWGHDVPNENPETAIMRVASVKLMLVSLGVPEENIINVVVSPFGYAGDVHDVRVFIFDESVAP